MIYHKIENNEVVDTKDLTPSELSNQVGLWVTQGSSEIATIKLEYKKLEERTWRNAELKNTDYIVYVTDHPQHSEYITYRQALRDWPSTSDFPATRPTL